MHDQDQRGQHGKQHRALPSANNHSSTGVAAPATRPDSEE